MKGPFPSRSIRMITNTACITAVLLACTLYSCREEDDPQGAAGALGKNFQLVLDEVTNSIVTSIVVSADGTKMIVVAQGANSKYYSSDGGTSFSGIDNVYAAEAEAVDNKGTFLLRNGRVFHNNTIVNLNAPGTVILGDNGKVFAYHHNEGKVFYKNVADASFTEAVMPVTPTPGSGGSTYYALKAMGKGLLFIDAKGTDTRTVHAMLLDESTLQWSERTFSVSVAAINGCGNLNRLERFTYAGTNTIIMTGCLGLALLDFSNGNTKIIAHPAIEGLPSIGNPLMDNKGQIYLVAGNYGTQALPLYIYNGSSWAPAPDVMSTPESGYVMTTDASNNVYYNSGSGAGESLTGLVKVNAQTGTKTAIGSPRVVARVHEAAMPAANALLVIANQKLVKYDAVTNKETAYDIGAVSHINILPDGKWITGGVDRVLISSDEGATWTETKGIFSKVNPQRAGATLATSRMVNGKLLLGGVFAYSYHNLTIGATQAKYDNIMIELNGSASTLLNYQFPSDFQPSCIGPDGTVYGKSFFFSDFGSSTDHYELKPNTAPLMLAKTVGYSPMIITDDGLQMAVGSSPSGSGMEILVRKATADQWAGANTILPGADGGFDWLKIRESAGRLLYTNGKSVYVAGN